MKEVVVYACTFCKETFDTNDAITCHLLNSHNQNKTIKKLRKQLSRKKTTTLKSSENIQKARTRSVDHEKKPRKYRKEFYCDLCDYKTVYRSTYQRHLLTHEEDGRQHKCELCSYAAVQPNNLKIHLETVHPFGAVEPVIIETTS